MKASRYNIYVEAHDKTIVYNPMTNALLTVDKELRSCLEKNEFESIDHSLMDSLKKCGIITDDIDELRVYRLKHNLTKYNTKKTSSFLVITTYTCNLECPYCYEGPADAEYRSQFMSPETTLQTIEFVKNQTLKNKSRMVGIGLYGGEPLLNMDCCETVLKSVSEWCKCNNILFYAALTTNGTLLDEKALARIGEYLSSVHITLDGPQNLHDKRRIKKNGSGSYSEILEHLKLLKDRKEHLSVRINVDEENRHLIHEILDDLEEIGLKGRPYFHIYFAQVIPQDACLTFPTDPEFKEWNRKFTWYHLPIMNMAIEKGWKDHLAVDLGESHSLVSLNIVSCEYAQYGKYSIDPYGDIYMCPASAGRTQYRIGKLENGGTWFPAYYHVMTRDPSLTLPCNQCEMLPMCGGGCSIASYFKYEDYHKTHCNFTKELIYERLKAYLQFRYPEKFEHIK
ncbi:MAG: radical SAM protein [Theionarchaea archaeon]|nr:radical SAM protein [Theionarchaea archaeon]